MQHAHHQFQYAGLFRRGLAFLLDSAMVSAISSSLAIGLFGLQAIIEAKNGVTLSSYDWRLLALDQGMPFLWAIGFWLLWMATPGKHLADCKLADANNFGRVSTGRLFIRYLGYILSALPLGLGFLWIAFDRRKQGWHDKLAGTVVIMQDASLAPMEAYR
jgi:uncharacterized RDD family membrane protein YckC